MCIRLNLKKLNQYFEYFTSTKDTICKENYNTSSNWWTKKIYSSLVMVTKILRKNILNIMPLSSVVGGGAFTIYTNAHSVYK